MTRTLTREPSYDVTTISDAGPLIEMMHAVDTERAAPDAGVVWWLYSSDDSEHELIVGVRDDRGCITWSEPTRSLVPHYGLNAEPVEYFTLDGHLYVQEPGSEVPVDVMWEAVREYIKTGERPTCLEWRTA